jgi:PleD family two-component response regulator
MINKSITENNKKRPIIGRLICRNNQKQIPLASESKNEMEKGTILIVDDNKGVLASLELLLETEFSEIKTAHHPNQIISIINTSPIDVIILDMNFSAGINNGNEGLYWLKRIREIAPALPVVMLTAYGDVELAVKALKNDATDFLLKPWDNRTLVRKIKDAFGSVPVSSLVRSGFIVFIIWTLYRLKFGQLIYILFCNWLIINVMFFLAYRLRPILCLN